MTLIDTHCHLDFPVLFKKHECLIENSINIGIRAIIIPAILAKRWDALINFTKKYPDFLYFALGLHPYFIAEHSQQDLMLLYGYLKQIKPIAIGEIGLDYYDNNLDKSKQHHFFEQQINIANMHQLPVIIHARKAHHDVIAILKKNNFKYGGVIHAFNGSFEQANEYMKLDFRFGVGGMITHPHAKHIRELAVNLPLESIVLETDAPDMPMYNQVTSYNSPENLLLIAQKLAKMRGISLEELGKQTTLNVVSTFKINIKAS